MPKCRICQADEKLQSVRADHVFGGNETYKFWQCERCDAIYMHPKLTDEEEKHFYKKEFEKFMSERVGDHRDWSNAENHIKTNQDQVERRWKFLKPHLKAGQKMLEIGCSSGFMLDAFHKSGLECTGVEPSGEFLEFLRRKGYNAYESLEELTASETQKYDFITHFFVFEHIANPFEFLRQTYDLLNEEGMIIAEIPSATDPLTSLYTIEAFEKFYWSIAHHYYYTPKSLRYILDKLGYTYELIPEQRYDLSNHMTWMMEGKPGGQHRYSETFSQQTLDFYKEDLKRCWLCDTIILKIYKAPQ